MMINQKERRLEILNYPHKLGLWLGYEMISELHGLWIKKVWRKDHDQDYLLLAHRNSLKTTSVVIIGVMWYLLFNPYASILLVRKTFSACEELLASIRDLYRSQKMKYLYQAMGIATDFSLKEDKKNRLCLSTAKNKGPEANIEIASIGFKGITGKHYSRIHLDDIVDEADMVSKKERKRTKYFYYNLKSVIKPGQFITATGTPWHQNDLYSLFVRVDRYPIGSVDLSFFPKSTLLKIKSRITPALFSSQYKLNFILDKNFLFKDPSMTDDWDEKISAYGHIDCAYGGQDFNAMTVIQLLDNGNIYVFGKVFKGHIINYYNDIISLVKKYNIKKIYLESNFDKGFVARDLRSKGISVSSYYETMSKYMKITTILYKYWNVLLFSKNCDSEYLSQIMEYSDDVVYDDAPDSLASLLLQMGIAFKLSFSSKKPCQTKETIKEWLNVMQRGSFL